MALSKLACCTHGVGFASRAGSGWLLGEEVEVQVGSWLSNDDPVAVDRAIPVLGLVQGVDGAGALVRGHQDFTV